MGYIGKMAIRYDMQYYQKRLLKGWKKVGKQRWRKGRIYLQLYKGTWKNNYSRYIVGHGSLNLSPNFFTKRRFFKKHSDAIKYIKNYMRNN